MKTANDEVIKRLILDIRPDTEPTYRKLPEGRWMVGNHTYPVRKPPLGKRIKLDGFTLVELMLVIAIMVILLALFLPILFGARDRARSVTCLSNLRQMGLAMQMYVQDHDDTYPIGAYQNNGVSVKGSWDTSWHDGLMPYFQNRVDAFLCPSTTGPRFYRRSYGVNPWICAYRGGITAAMVEGSPRVLVAEKATGDWPVYPRSYFDGPSHLYLTEPHTGRLHVLYTDGRVATTTAFELASVASSWAPKP